MRTLRMCVPWATTLLCAFCVAMATPAIAHDLQTQVTLRAGFVLLQASYEGEEAGSFLAVRVDAPVTPGAAASDAFQTGRTDREGRFAFQPHVAGMWKISVDDEMGHRATTEVQVPDPKSDEAAPAPTPVGDAPRNTSDKLLVGLSLLFGVTGMLMAWVSRRSPRQG